MFDRLKDLLAGGSSKDSQSRSSSAGARQPKLPEPSTRQSNGLEQFFASLKDRSNLNILDFAGASQANVTFITSLGHRLSSEDFVRALEASFGEEDVLQHQGNPALMEAFLQENLSFPPDFFDGALVWDSLQYLSPHLLQLTVDRLFDAMRPGSYLLAFFHADEKAKQITAYHYRISDYRNLLLAARGYRPSGQFFNNRAIEKVFSRYSVVKFFLTRDNLREVLVKR